MTDKEIEDARAKELEQYVGKSFFRKDGRGIITTVIKYDGIKIHQEYKNGLPTAVKSHTFLVRNRDSQWTPAATRFLEEYNQVEFTAPSETSNVAI